MVLGVFTMKKPINQVEAELKREFTKFHKSLIGKGPSNTCVKVFDNIIFIKFQDAFSSIETSLLDMPNGKAIIETIRNDLFSANIKKFTQSIDILANNVLADVITSINIKNAEVYILLIFADIIKFAS
jgi:uncharacterized protein YbcI